MRKDGYQMGRMRRSYLTVKNEEGSTMKVKNEEGRISNGKNEEEEF
jgi:hypothetical protein